ncbi:MAG: hypothetical protein IKI25_10140 [Bacteroidales bacterium]|nr:hypothetical protein [Bacteroidales bacterium]MBR7036103.1 hypothetical protein [Bacteroidales bacterium]
MNKRMLALGIIVLAIGAVVVFFTCGYSKQYRNFSNEMRSRAENINENTEYCSEDEINQLPTCLRDFCTFINLAETKKHNVLHCLFKNADFVFNEKKGMNIQMDYDLWIFADSPLREAFCKSSIMGIPFEGIDYFDEEKRTGGMKGYIAKLFQLFDQEVPNMERTMYITLLAESAMLNPSFLFSKYVEYQEIDSTKCFAKITYNGISGEGYFTFDKEHGVLRYESAQRQEPEVEDGKTIPVGWRCEGGNFHDGKEFKIPSYCKVTKIYPDREVVYFDAKEYEMELEK